MVILLLAIDLVIIAIVVNTGRDHELSVRRLETIAATYAAEAGVNMSIREMMEAADEDGDGAVGSISDDGDSGNDPTLGQARFSVVVSPDDPVAGQTTVTSEGRSGLSVRKMTTTLE